MNVLRCVAAAAVALPILFVVPSAQALEAIQYKAQGNGRYIHSSGSPVRHYGYGRPWHRHWHYRSWRHRHWHNRR